MTGAPDNDEGTFDAEAIEAARRLFAGACDFIAGAASVESLPVADLPEVAFAGRSNVGKSSLVNALTGRKALARTSNTPGRTQQINFFDLGHRLMLVDLPGYGYHQAGMGKARTWSRLIMLYLKGRQPLRRVLLLIDARRGIGDADRDVMTALDGAAVSYQVVLTKADQLAAGETEAAAARAVTELAKRPAAHPAVAVTSSRDGTGIAELRAALAALALPSVSR